MSEFRLISQSLILLSASGVASYCVLN